MIRKLDNGKYLVQLCFTVDGQRYRPSKTFNTKGECNVWIAEQRLFQSKAHESSMTVREAIIKYIELSEMLSPTTIRGYNIILKYAFKNIMDTPVNQLTDESMQKAINKESKRAKTQSKKGQIIAPKTVINEWELLSPALKYYTGRTFNVRLPKLTKKEKTYPTPEQVFNIIKGTPVEIPCLMAMCLSYRMGEVRGARYEDIKDGYLYIRQVKTYAGQEIVKERAKTYKSNRKIKLPTYLLNLIESTKEGEYIVKLKSYQIYGRYTRLMHRNGFDITFHDLRHIFASTGALLKISTLYTAEIGGWEGKATVENVYEECFDSERSKAENEFCAYFDAILCNEKEKKITVNLRSKKLITNRLLINAHKP